MECMTCLSLRIYACHSHIKLSLPNLTCWDGRDRHERQKSDDKEQDCVTAGK